MLTIIEHDYKRYSAGASGNLWRYCLRALSHAGFRAVVLYRLEVWLRRHRLRFLGAIAQRIMHHACHCWISPQAEIGPGFLIAHVGGIGIGGGTRIGSNCDVRRNVSLAGNFGKTDENGRHHPWIGDNVSFGVGAVVAGPVRIGSGSIVGANSVVTRDVPEGVIVFGVPAKVIKPRWNKDSGREL